ncbi:MAG: signal peptidase I [Chloroflexi bacterium]|nr:MAG: signal peptidase I [Chloroflexota bacterium]
MIDILETIFLSVVLFVGINLVSSRIRVESISMQPTLYAGNFVLVNKLAFNFVEPERGDVIVFKYPPDPTQVPYIKRIIGLPGDTIHIEGGKVFINGQELIEPYLVEPTNRGGDWVVPENNLFVMGDNRNSSSDSRTWGTVPMENIIGRAEIVYWPPEKWGLLHMNTAIAGSAP